MLNYIYIYFENGMEKKDIQMFMIVKKIKKNKKITD